MGLMGGDAKGTARRPGCPWCFPVLGARLHSRSVRYAIRSAMKQPKSAIPAKRASKGPRGKRTPPQSRQYTVAELERARDRVEAAERRIENDHTSNPNRGRAGLERAQLELHIIESQLRLRGLLE